MSSDYRAFRGVWIPAEVWLSQDMTLQEKVMLVEINSLQHPERGCYKSNKRLAEFFQISAARVSQVIASLVSKGLVRVEIVREGGQVVERRIFMSAPFEAPKRPDEREVGGSKNPEGGSKNPEGGVVNILKESNTFLRGSSEEDLAPTVHSRSASPKRPAIPVHEIVSLYHQHLPMCPRVMKVTKARAGAIQARWRSGDLPDLETWSEYFQFVAESRFLTGQVQPAPGRRRFVADLEWLAKEGNYAKVYERKFHEVR